MKEVWSDIEGYNGKYQISNLGRVKSHKFNDETIMRGSIGNRKYPLVELSINGRRKSCLTHRLVAKAFIPNPLNKKEVNHIDGNKKNNRVDNLEWATHIENMNHAYKTGLVTSAGEKHPKSKLDDMKVLTILTMPKVFTGKRLGEHFNVGHGLISTIRSGRRWKHIYKFINE